MDLASASAEACYRLTCSEAERYQQLANLIAFGKGIDDPATRRLYEQLLAARDAVSHLARLMRYGVHVP